MFDSPVVVGIDVGGPQKGFHAVALQGKEIVDKVQCCDAGKIADWCTRHQARCIGVDAPCGWRHGEDKRQAELDLIEAKIRCFYTPARENSSGNFYSWMLNGEWLFQCLSSTHPLFGKYPAQEGRSFETFPHAVACALAGKIVSAKEKRTCRLALLKEAGVEFSERPGIDFIDAALCALTADYFARGEVLKFGEPATGYIVVPKIAGSFLSADGSVWAPPTRSRKG